MHLFTVRRWTPIYSQLLVQKCVLPESVLYVLLITVRVIWNPRTILPFQNTSFVSDSPVLTFLVHTTERSRIPLQKMFSRFYRRSIACLVWRILDRFCHSKPIFLITTVRFSHSLFHSSARCLCSCIYFFFTFETKYRIFFFVLTFDTKVVLAH